MYDQGASYSLVNYHRSCVSKFPSGVDGIAVGKHHLVSQAVKTVFTMRPPLPKYIATYDISTVLPTLSRCLLMRNCLYSSWHLEHCTYWRLQLFVDWAVFAVWDHQYSFLKWVYSHFLFVCFNYLMQELCVIPGKAAPTFTCQRFHLCPKYPDNQSLCPVGALSINIKKVYVFLTTLINDRFPFRSKIYCLEGPLSSSQIADHVVL